MFVVPLVDAPKNVKMQSMNIKIYKNGGPQTPLSSLQNTCMFEWWNRDESGASEAPNKT
jgi:hypothetical protein